MVVLMDRHLTMLMLPDTQNGESGAYDPFASASSEPSNPGRPSTHSHLVLSHPAAFEANFADFAQFDSGSSSAAPAAAERMVFLGSNTIIDDLQPILLTFRPRKHSRPAQHRQLPSTSLPPSLPKHRNLPPSISLHLNPLPLQSQRSPTRLTRSMTLV
jgi:hypothetical protein